MVYTLVERELRDAMRRLCRRSRVHYCDLLGHPIDSISRVAGVAARMEAGARAPLDETYFKRIEAIEFAVRYDDGVGGGLDEADIVLVGVSRTSKTPLSIYLGYLGHKAANVPIVKGVEPPRALFEIDRAKIVGLDDRPRAPRRDPRGARAVDGRAAEAVRRPRGRVRGAREGRIADPPPAALPRDRRLRPLRRGDRDADHPPRRRAGAAARRRRRRDRPNAKYGPLARGVRRDMTEKGWVPLRYWVIWWAALAVAMVRLLRRPDADLARAAGARVGGRAAVAARGPR